MFIFDIQDLKQEVTSIVKLVNTVNVSIIHTPSSNPNCNPDVALTAEL